MTGRCLVDQNFVAKLNNAVQASRLHNFAQDESLALQCVAKSSDFAIHKRLQSRFLSLDDSLDERKTALREFEAFRDQDYNRFLHADSVTRTFFSDCANTQKARWWIDLLRAPVGLLILAEKYARVSFYLALFTFCLQFRLLLYRLWRSSRACRRFGCSYQRFGSGSIHSTLVT